MTNLPVPICMMHMKDRLQLLLDLVKIEREEDLQQYQARIQNLTIAERRAAGTCWFPLIIKDTGFTASENPWVEVERPATHAASHQFSAGKNVTLFRQGLKGIEESVQGVIRGAGFNNLKIILQADDFPDWLDEGKIGVELMFDEVTYKEMEKALREVMRADRGRLAELRDILYGVKTARFDSSKVETAPHLNTSQQAAVAHIIKARDVAVVHGPPGTGKTTTLTEAIRLTLQSEKQVLVCAPSNTAVDLLTEKLSALGLKVLRIGNPARVSEDLLRHTPEAQIAQHRDYALIKQLRRSATEYNQMARKYKRNFGKAEREQRKALLAEARKLSREAEDIERYITDSLLTEAQVIACTPVGSVNRLLGDLEFSTVFIDEAAQALEPATWIPILKAKRVIFAGDPFQLPATVKSYEAARKGLSVSLIENVIQIKDLSVMLQTQYRMHEQIMEFSNRQFYGGRLEAHSSVAKALLGSVEPLNQPVTFIDTAGTGYEEKTDPESSSTYNPGEADLLLQYLVQLVNELSKTEPELLQRKGSIGIISPYKAQVEYLQQRLKEHEPLLNYEKAFSLGTVDGFQGQEREVICISLVRSNENGEIGFLEDTRRTNVALTRAKRKLLVIGDSATLSNNVFYNQMLAYFEEINSYKSAWEYMY